MRVEGEQILVTGASSGLGLALSQVLAERGATVLMACRSRLEEAPAEIRRRVPHAELEVFDVDLADPERIERLLDRLDERGQPLHRVVLNAGVVTARSRTTAAGLDTMVHVNFLANVQLMRGLRRRQLLRPGARVVVVGSEAHRSTPAIDLDTWMEPIPYTTSGALKMYGASKRLLHTWAEALAARAPELHVVHLCPGAIASNIARDAPASMRWILRPVLGLLFPSPAKVAAWVSWVALSPELDGRTGVYVHLGREKEPGEGVRDPAVGTALWERAHALLDQIHQET